jgi:hypothetical protein
MSCDIKCDIKCDIIFHLFLSKANRHKTVLPVLSTQYEGLIPQARCDTKSSVCQYCPCPRHYFQTLITGKQKNTQAVTVYYISLHNALLIPQGQFEPVQGGVQLGLCKRLLSSDTLWTEQCHSLVCRLRTEVSHLARGFVI